MIIYTPLHKIIAQFAHLYIQMQKQKKKKGFSCTILQKEHFYCFLVRHNPICGQGATYVKREEQHGLWKCKILNIGFAPGIDFIIPGRQ